MSVTASSPQRLETIARDGPVIVVGYDGSEESRRALIVAAERAGPQGTVVPLHVMPTASSWLGAPYYDREVEEGQLAAQAVLAEIDDVETRPARIEPELIEGEPAEALLRVAQSRNAREIVIGSRGLGRFRSLLGSVSRALLERADRPVMIVPRGAVDVDHQA